MLSNDDKDTIVNAVVNFDDMSDDAYEALYEHYLNSGEMPYGVAKAKTGDPYAWIHEQVQILWDTNPEYFKKLLGDI